MGSDYYQDEQAREYDRLKARIKEESDRADKLIKQLCELQDKYDKLKALYDAKEVSYG